METKKISELTEVTSPTSTDVFPIVNDGETKKVQLTNIKNTLGINEIDTRLTTAEAEIDTAQSDINNFEWKLVGSATGQTPINIPTGAKEIKLIGIINNNNIYSTQLYIDDILTIDTFAYGGYYDTTLNYLMIAWYGTKEHFGLARANSSGTNVTSTTVTKMYYR